jgi:hypothetical protein
VAELDEHRINDTLSRLPSELRQNWDPLVHTLTDEMKEDYLLSVKKAIGKTNEGSNPVTNVVRKMSTFSS